MLLVKRYIQSVSRKHVTGFFISAICRESSRVQLAFKNSIAMKAVLTLANSVPLRLLEDFPRKLATEQ